MKGTTMVNSVFLISNIYILLLFFLIFWQSNKFAIINQTPCIMLVHDCNKKQHKPKKFIIWQLLFWKTCWQNISPRIVIFEPNSFSVFCYKLSINSSNIFSSSTITKPVFFSTFLLIFMNLSQDYLASNSNLNCH